MSQDKKPKPLDIPPGGTTMDSLVAQWNRERPDIDPASMVVCGEIWRAGERLRRAVLANLSDNDLDMAGFDVILSLRRQGKGKSLSPSALSKEMMLSTSAMTNRLDRLEKRGLIKRTQDPKDRRGLKIILSEAGFALADKLVLSHVEAEQRMLSGLTASEQDLLRSLLPKIG